MKSLKYSWWLGAALAAGCAFTTTAKAQDATANATTANAAPAGNADAATTAKEPQSFPQGILFPYYLLDRALYKNVDNDGHVNYVGIQNDKEASQSLDYFIQAVGNADLSQFPVLPNKTMVKDKLGREVEQVTEDRSPELVFWINAYNALVLKAILAAYPVSSPDDIKDFDTAKTRRVAGKDYSLADMRKKIVDADPRALFALTDGTLGGPFLRQTAYRYSDIQASLDRAVQLYVSNPNQVQLLMLEKKATINPMLAQADQYFAPKTSKRKWDGIRQLLARYSLVGSSQRFFVNNPDVELAFGRANRNLNRDPNQSPVSTS